MEISDVFTAGGIPNITYNSRENLQLEKKLERQLKVKGKLISITGPTKIGKTVLCKKVISEEHCVFIPGGYIKSEGDLWENILTQLTIPYSWDEEESTGETTRYDEGTHGSLNLFSIGRAGVRDLHSESMNVATKTSKTFTTNPIAKSIQELISLNIPLIIDDFHYIERDIQTSIIRALKEPISRGLKVITLSVPHRDHDAIKVENEMTGRVYQLRVSPWNKDELKEIAIKGFEALNLDCPPEIIEIFIKESHKSPHLMQEFCYHLCLENDIDIQQEETKALTTPEDFEEFFREIVETSASKVIYEKLVSGPKSRDRKMRDFKNGRQGDIYEAVMFALADLLEINPITPDEIRRQLQDILEARSVPQRQQITQVLTQMAKIAKEDIEGEPALDFEDDQLHIVDPFFSFYLKWCEK